MLSMTAKCVIFMLFLKEALPQGINRVLSGNDMTHTLNVQDPIQAQIGDLNTAVILD